MSSEMNLFKASVPDLYAIQLKEGREEMSILFDDYAIIRENKKTSHYIRCEASLRIKESLKLFTMEIWCAVSYEDFLVITEKKGDPSYEKIFEGFLGNRIPLYQVEGSVAVKIFFNGGSAGLPVWEPYIERSHPFMRDFINGIDKERLLRFIDFYGKIFKSNAKERKKFKKIIESRKFM